MAISTSNAWTTHFIPLKSPHPRSSPRVAAYHGRKY